MTTRFLSFSTVQALALSALLYCSGCTDREPGVMAANHMQKYALERIAQGNILNEEEKILVYYDHTLDLSAEEGSLVTDSRVIHYSGSMIYDIPVKDITKIDHNESSIGEDIIQVYGTDGSVIVISIPPFNGGELFLNILKNTAESSSSGS